MRAEYTLITGELSEQELVKMFNKTLKRLEKMSKDPRVKNLKLKKRVPQGVSDPDAENFQYEYEYDFQDRYLLIFAQLYPNINFSQEVKFDIEGATWNIYIKDSRDDEMKRETKPLIEEFFQDMPVEYVLIKEYTGDENRL